MNSFLKKAQKLYLYYGIVLSVYLAYLILNKEINIFFIVYLYWWDSFLHALFTRVALGRTKRTEEVIKKIEILNTHFFMSFIHLLFTIILFGFVMTDSDTINSYVNSIKILLFRDAYFNAAFLVIILRGLNLLFFQRKNHLETRLPVMSSGFVVLHISLILGPFMWYGAQHGKWGIEDLFGDLNSVAYVFPFLILKICTELFANRKSLF
jgi:hypothetical protein